MNKLSVYCTPDIEYHNKGEFEEEYHTNITWVTWVTCKGNSLLLTEAKETPTMLTFVRMELNH